LTGGLTGRFDRLFDRKDSFTGRLNWRFDRAFDRLFDRKDSFTGRLNWRLDRAFDRAFGWPGDRRRSPPLLIQGDNKDFEEKLAEQLFAGEEMPDKKVKGWGVGGGCLGVNGGWGFGDLPAAATNPTPIRAPCPPPATAGGP
jgi:hypothetical protein